MGAAFNKFCAQMCCCFCCADDDVVEEEEKQPLIPHDPLEYIDREQQKRRDQETNLWSTPGDPSHSEREDDRTLYHLIQARNKTRMGSTGYRRLSVDIEAMRDTRREVRDKWRTVLENLGFVAEADSLLAVNANTSCDRMRNAAVARSLLSTLSNETSIFNSSKDPPPERYLFILDRLIYLDVADDFVAKAKRFYPPDAEEETSGGLSINLPLLLARVEAMNGAGDDDEDDISGSEREDGNYSDRS